MDRVAFENLVISCILNDKDAFTQVRHILTENDFSVPLNKSIYRYYNENDDADMPTVLMKYGEGVIHLMQIAPSSEGLQRYVDNMLRLKTTHDFALKLNDISKDLRRTPELLPMLIETVQADIKAMHTRYTDTSISFTDSMLRATEEIDAYVNGNTGIKTGLTSIDDIIMGFKPGLYVVSGRPHMGKTTFTVLMAMHMAKHGHNVLYCPLEDGDTQMSKIMLAHEINVPFKTLAAGLCDERTLYDAANRISQLPVRFLNKISPEILRRHLDKNKGKVDIVFIDQLNYVESNRRISDRRQELNDIIRNVKKIAVDYGIPIILIAQLNRGVDTRQDKRPFLSDLKETGSLEEDADVVMLLYRDAYYNHSADDFLEVIVAKNKKTYETGTVTLKIANGKILTGRIKNA